LRQFYGLKDGQETPVKGEGRTGHVEMRTQFDVEGYFEELVQKSSLVELMKAASSLSVDIEKLQGQRHSLVYNHHHKVSQALRWGMSQV
jgi:hypothetical protein